MCNGTTCRQSETSEWMRLQLLHCSHAQLVMHHMHMSLCGQHYFAWLTTAFIFCTTACISATWISCISSLHAFRHLLLMHLLFMHTCLWLQLHACFLASATPLVLHYYCVTSHPCAAYIYYVSYLVIVSVYPVIIQFLCPHDSTPMHHTYNQDITHPRNRPAGVFELQMGNVSRNTV